MSKRGFANPQQTRQRDNQYTTTIRQSKMTREKEKNNKQQTTNVKTQKNQTKSCCSYTQLGQIEARKWYRCLQTDRERVCVKKVMPPSILISVHPKNPQPKREQKTNRAKCWMDWVDGDDSGSEVGWRSELVRLRLTCAGTRVAAEQRNPHRKRRIGRIE